MKQHGPKELESSRMTLAS